MACEGLRGDFEFLNFQLYIFRLAGVDTFHLSNNTFFLLYF